MQELHAIVHGKVQGVWYRAWTRDTAREMGVTGWVRNMSTGEVETMALAEKDVLDTFIERLHDGPPLARVTRIETALHDPKEEFDSFEVRT